MYEAINFENLIGTAGFSDNLLKTHFGLYEGYVKNTNTVAERLKEMLKSEETGPGEYAELKRRFGWEFNGMRLHELYFDNMANGGVVFDENSKVAELIKNSFGSHEEWSKDFVATGSLRGIGWAVLFHDKKSDKLFNVWVNEHDVGHLAGTTPLLVMDVFEHAFILDYGMKRAEYISAFMNALDWKKVNDRLV